MEKHGILDKELSYNIIGAAMEVHRLLGSGFLEAVYENALAHEFGRKVFLSPGQTHLPVSYKEIVVGDYYADFNVDQQVILEIKAVSKLNSAHEAQAHHYLAATGITLAILINFCAPSLEYKRIIRSNR